MNWTGIVSHFEQVETRFPPPPADVPDEPLPAAETFAAPAVEIEASATTEAEPEPKPSTSDVVYEQVETRRDD